ncbi:MAG: Hpt domain-containing protein [Christensenellaceae bacterium]|jgi:HPt (histidine-containing phosphotransfer) domain-containing protein
MQNEKQYINIEEGLGRVRNNQGLYVKMLQMFLANDSLDTLKEAYAAGDMAKAADVAHGIKGMTGNLSLSAVYQESTQLNEDFKNGVAVSQEAFDGFVKTYEETVSVVTKTISELS